MFAQKQKDICQKKLISQYNIPTRTYNPAYTKRFIRNLTNHLSLTKQQSNIIDAMEYFVTGVKTTLEKLQQNMGTFEFEDIDEKTDVFNTNVETEIEQDKETEPKNEYELKQKIEECDQQIENKNHTKKSPMALQKLPLVVLFKICMHLDFNDVYNLSSTCRALNTIGNEALNYKRTYKLHSSNNSLVSRKWEQKLIYTALRLMEPRKLFLHRLGAYNVSLIDVLLAVQKKLMLESTESILMLDAQEYNNSNKKNDETVDVDIRVTKEEKEEEEEEEEEEKEEEEVEEKKKYLYIKKMNLNDFDLTKNSVEIFVNSTQEFNDSNDHSTLLNYSDNNITPFKLLDDIVKPDFLTEVEAFNESDESVVSKDKNIMDSGENNELPYTQVSEKVVLPLLNSSTSELNDLSSKNILYSGTPNQSDYSDNLAEEIVINEFPNTKKIDDSLIDSKDQGNSVFVGEYERLENNTYAAIIGGLESILLEPSISSTKAKIALFENATRENSMSPYPLPTSQGSHKLFSTSSSPKLDTSVIEFFEQSSPSFKADCVFDNNINHINKEDLEDLDQDTVSDSSFELVRQLQNSSSVKDKKLLFETLVEKTHELTLRNSHHYKQSRTHKKRSINGIGVRKVSDKYLVQQEASTAEDSFIIEKIEDCEKQKLENHTKNTLYVKNSSKELQQIPDNISSSNHIQNA